METVHGRLEPERAYAVWLIWRQGGEEVISEAVWFTTPAASSRARPTAGCAREERPTIL